MTEDDWLYGSNPYHLMPKIQGNARRMRLFGAAICRRYPEPSDDPRCEQVLDFAEELADGLPPAPERLSVWFLLMDKYLDKPSDHLKACLLVSQVKHNGELLRFGSKPTELEEWIVEASRCLVERPMGHPERTERHFREMERLEQADIIRELVGNPFQPIDFDPAWRTSTVLEVGKAIYDQKRFEQLPILADALVDAGCDVPAIIEHFHSGMQHVRGCWALDAVVGRH